MAISGHLSIWNRAAYPGSKNMKPRITVITLGVDDLERSLVFYRDESWFADTGIFGAEFEYGAVAFFDLHAGLKLAIWPRKSIAHDTGIALGTAERNRVHDRAQRRVKG